MPNFLAVHTMSKPVTVEEAASMGRRVKIHTTDEVRWTGSWVQLTESGMVSRIFCSWGAPDAKSVKEVLDKAPGLPLDGIYPMAIVDPETL